MLIPLSEMLQRHHLQLKGVLHIGAHACEEFAAYQAAGLTVDQIQWVEANPALVEALRVAHPDFHVHTATVGATDGQEVDFIVTNNGQSSSILELGTHAAAYPDIVEVKRHRQVTTTIDTLFREKKLDVTAYNFVNIDIQGAELLALRGMTTILPHVDALYLEVNVQPLYQGCPMVEDIERFVRTYGFHRVDMRLTEHGWGDALFIKTAPPPVHPAWQWLDSVVYINLARRADRRAEMEAELTRLQVPRHKIVSFEAIASQPGMLGCSKSHLEVAKLCRARKERNTLILEDDFNFHPDADLVRAKLSQFSEQYGSTYHVVMLASHTLQAEPKDELVQYARRAMTCAGYILADRFQEALIGCWNTSYPQLVLTRQHWLYMCDTAWCQLQTTGPFYVFRPRLGYQRVSHSDLSGTTRLLTEELTNAEPNDAPVVASRHRIFEQIQVEHLKGQHEAVIHLYSSADWTDYEGPGSDFTLWDIVSISAFYAGADAKSKGAQAFAELLKRVDFTIPHHWERWQLHRKRLEANLSFYPEARSLWSPAMEQGHPNYISAEVVGGLGNQLFQIATALALGWETSRPVIFERTTSSPSCFQPRPVYWETLCRQVVTWPSALYAKIPFVEISERVDRRYEEFKLPAQPVRLKGYFQSAKYFEAHAERLRKLFTLTIPPDLVLPKSTPRVCLHVRRGDYLKLAGLHDILPLSYYQAAIQHFPVETHFLIFSDDPDWCRLHFKGPQYEVITATSDVMELQLMAQCDGYILANSSFSWWGCFLNPNVKLPVVAPKQWFGSHVEYSWADIYRPGWILL